MSFAACHGFDSINSTVQDIVIDDYIDDMTQLDCFPSIEGPYEDLVNNCITGLL